MNIQNCNKGGNKRPYQIQKAAANDASEIADLSRQFGYPVSRTDITERLNVIIHSAEDTVFVACLTDGTIVGWIHLLNPQS